MDANICIYTGPGTNEVCTRMTELSFMKLLGEEGQHRVVTIAHPSDFASERSLALGNTLVMPGGDTSSIARGGDLSASKINRFIQEEKGSYIGICAGAYAGGPRVICAESPDFQSAGIFSFTRTPNYVFLTEKQLSLSYGRDFKQLVVPIFDLKSGKTMQMLYWGGGGYKTAADSEEIVAYYGTEEEHPHIAVLKPRKNVFLTNVHPELQIADRPYDYSEYYRRAEDRVLTCSDEEKTLLEKNRTAVIDWFRGELIGLGILGASEEAASSS